MGAPYTSIYAIPVDRFESFDRLLASVEEAGTMAAWHSFFEHFDYFPTETVPKLERAGMADGVEPNWYNETLVSGLQQALIKGCVYIYTEPNLIQDMWSFRDPDKRLRLLHRACAARGSFQLASSGCSSSTGICLTWRWRTASPGACLRHSSAKHRWCKWFLKKIRRETYGDADAIDRETASGVVFRYSFPCCLLCARADESILFPDRRDDSRRGVSMKEYPGAVPACLALRKPCVSEIMSCGSRSFSDALRNLTRIFIPLRIELERSEGLEHSVHSSSRPPEPKASSIKETDSCD